MRQPKNLWWKTFWVSVLASLFAMLLWAILSGSSDSRMRFRMEFERTPLATDSLEDAG
ncbi:MAG TPA: hypothetical protein VHG93_15185 [Longimicrobium sp.]|nr:hypothetical protein [Longimicrobium sp.]